MMSNLPFEEVKRPPDIGGHGGGVGRAPAPPKVYMQDFSDRIKITVPSWVRIYRYPLSYAPYPARNLSRRLEVPELPRTPVTREMLSIPKFLRVEPWLRLLAGPEIQYNPTEEDWVWIRKQGGVVVPPEWQECPTPVCHAGATFIEYHAGASCLALGSCPDQQAYHGDLAPLVGPQNAFGKHVSPHPVDPLAVMLHQQWHFTGAGTPSPIVISPEGTIPMWSEGVNQSVTPMISPQKLVDAVPGYDVDGHSLTHPSRLAGVSVGLGAGYPTLNVSRDHATLIITQLAAQPGVRVAPRGLQVRREDHVKEPSRQEKGKSKLAVATARALKVYQAFTEVTDAIDSIYRALPGKYRRGPKRNYDKFLAVWAHIDEVSIPHAILNLIYNHYEDRVVGRTAARFSRAGASARGAGLHAPNTTQIGQFGRQLQAYDTMGEVPYEALLPASLSTKVIPRYEMRDIGG